MSVILASAFVLVFWHFRQTEWHPAQRALSAACRAGAIVLLIGFCFDGGLFKLATASTFWILLELGCADLVQQKVTKRTKKRLLRVLFPLFASVQRRRD